MNFWIELCGWIGGLGYALFSVPQTWRVIKEGNAKALSLGFLCLMFAGAVCSLIYIFPTNNLPLKINFMLSLICSVIMLRYKLFERK